MGLEEQLEQQKKLTSHYQGLSGIYLAEIEDLNRPVAKILEAKGVMVEIESDLLNFLKKNKETDKSRIQKERIEVMNECLQYFEKIALQNYEMKLLLRQAGRKLNLEKEAHAATIKALEIQTNMINEE